MANYQGVENPIRVNYDLQGGSGGPTTDWVWNADGLWKMTMILSQLKQAINLLDGILKQMERKQDRGSFAGC